MLSLSFPEPELPPVLPERRELMRSEAPLPVSPVFPADPLEARRAPRSSTALLSPSRRLMAAFFVPASAFL